MNCSRCGAAIEPGDEREHAVGVLCEDCYMDALSPTRTCDPWAVHSATNSLRHAKAAPALTTLQEEILAILRETGGLTREELLSRLAGRVAPGELEREFAALRHMEKARGEMRGNRVVVCLW